MFSLRLWLLKRRLRSRDPRRQGEAIERLARMTCQDGIDAVVSFIETDRSSERRFHAIASLAQIDHPNAIGALRRLVDTIGRLAQAGEAGAVRVLTRLVEGRGDAETKRRAIWSLAESVSSEAIEYLVASIRREHASALEIVTSALLTHGTPTIHETVLHVFAEKLETCDSLFDSGIGTEAILKLLEGLSQQDIAKHETAFRQVVDKINRSSRYHIWARWPSRRLERLILARVSASSGSDDTPSVAMLGEFGWCESIMPLLDMAASRGPSARMAVEAALKRIWERLDRKVMYMCPRCGSAFYTVGNVTGWTCDACHLRARSRPPSP